MPDDRRRSAEDRLDALERSLLDHLAELRSLRAELRSAATTAVPERQPESTDAPRGPAPSHAQAPRPASPPRSRPPARKELDVEELVGRYGTLVIATLAILLGVGAFLQWAISRGLLGPEVRVILGAVAAVVLAILGLRLRKRGGERFGDVLLVIAFAVVHLDAWAAGPGLHLVPNSAALVIAAVASAALAAFAIAEGEQILFALGIGGALAAPFVADWHGVSSGPLLGYGWIVLAAATVALGNAEWTIARRIISVATGLYVVAGAVNLVPGAGPEVARLPALFALAVALTSTALGHAAHRRALARAALAYMVLALMVVVGRRGAEWQEVAIAFVGLLAVHVIQRRKSLTRTASGAASLMEALALPVAFHLVAWMALDDPTTLHHAGVAATWAIVALVAAAGATPGERATHVAAALTSLQVGVILSATDHEVVLAVLSAVVLLASLRAVVEWRDRSLFVPLLLCLLVTTLAAYVAMEDRTAFAYTPFLTTASVAAFAATASWVVSARLVPQGYFPLRAAGIVAIFAWGYAEFAEAFSRDLATFLLITYNAVFGVVLIGIGRSRGAAGYRHAGLALALFAAAKAVVQASDLSNIGLRVASYLVVGIFLLGVGYWYRAGREDQPA